MRILQVMPQYPFPMVDGGKVSLGQTALAYARAGHKVFVLCYGDDPAPLNTPKDLNITVIPHSTRNTPLRILGSLFTRRSLYLSKHDTTTMRAAVDRLIEQEQIEVLIADHTCMAPLVQDAAQRHGLVGGLRLHNIEWMIWQRYAERLPAWHPGRWYIRGQAAKVRREETEVIRRADAVFTISPVDTLRAHELVQQANVITAPAGVVPDEWVRTRRPSTPPQVIYASNFRWIHNVDALRWFVTEVWPTVRARTAAQFHVVGVEVPDWVAERTSQGVYADGFVTSLADRYASASVSVAPLFVGSGMRLKILEAMAAGLPVVATSISAEGIELSGEEGLFRTDTPESTAEAIIRLVQDAELCGRVGRSAQQAVQRSYTWDASVQRMAEELQHHWRDGE